MILQLIKKRYLNNKYKRRFPNALIGNGVYISDSYIGEDTEILANSKIIGTHLAKSVKITENCVIIKSNIDEYVSINNNVSLANVTIGSYSYVTQNSILNLTQIGRFCSIGPYFICGYGDHPTDFVSTSPVFFSNMKQCGISFTDKKLFNENKDIIIGNDVWIGARVFVRDGVKIGNGAIIAAGAVVVKDIPDYAIVGGVPARIIRFRFSNDQIKELQRIQWWNWPKDELQKAQPYFAQKDMLSFINYAKQK